MALAKLLHALHHVDLSHATWSAVSGVQPTAQALLIAILTTLLGAATGQAASGHEHQRILLRPRALRSCLLPDPMTQSASVPQTGHCGDMGCTSLHSFANTAAKTVFHPAPPSRTLFANRVGCTCLCLPGVTGRGAPPLSTQKPHSPSTLWLDVFSFLHRCTQHNIGYDEVWETASLCHSQHDCRARRGRLGAGLCRDLRTSSEGNTGT